MPDPVTIPTALDLAAAEKAAADEARLERLRVQYTKIGIVEWDDHELIFKLPSREMVREYRRKLQSELEKPDALEQLSQAMIVAFDGVDEPNAARIKYTGEFLFRFPAFTSSQRVINVLSALAGIISEEDAKELGKGVRVKSATAKPTPAA